ncbi:uncharacterized protein LOC134834759 [Culicoides brevitarsis]|uniref:uncharacterized protein LOC134834759 n=1 Tax=Culicoides brevitarsis TaxID=469753 RepID=UPI00307C157E
MDSNASKTVSKQRGVTNCVINLTKTFITPTQAALLVNATLENIMLFSGQIPFGFPVFKERVRQATKDQENQPKNAQNWSSSMQSKQLEAAKGIVDAISTIKENVIKEFKKTVIKEVVIGFGSTIFSLKHAFVIRLPKVDQNHYCSSHERENVSLIMNFSRQLALSEAISTEIDGKSQKIFLLLRKSGENQSVEEFFRPMPGFQLPKNCKTVCLEVLLKEAEEKKDENCCKMMKICSEVTNLKIESSEVEAESVKDACNWFISSLPITGMKKSF